MLRQLVPNYPSGARKPEHSLSGTVSGRRALEQPVARAGRTATWTVRISDERLADPTCTPASSTTTTCGAGRRIRPTGCSTGAPGTVTPMTIWR